MIRIVNIFLFLIIIVFIFSVFRYYSLNIHINANNSKRPNIEQILKSKINDLPVLPNDTENVIEFNNSFNGEINNEKNRSFWELLKIK